MHETLLNSKVSKNIRNQGETLFCWAFAISTMLRQSLNLFISQLDGSKIQRDDALKKLNGTSTFNPQKESEDSTSHNRDNVDIENVAVDNVDTAIIDQASSDIDSDDTDESDYSVELDKIDEFFGALHRKLSKLNGIDINSDDKNNADKNSLDGKNVDIDDLELLLSQMDDTQLHLTATIFSDIFANSDADNIDTDRVETKTPEENSAGTDTVDIDFHRQLRNELIMIPIPKSLSNEFIEESPLTQGHYLDMAFERVGNLLNQNRYNLYHIRFDSFILFS